jgi:hypothetical protein
MRWTCLLGAILAAVALPGCGGDDDDGGGGGGGREIDAATLTQNLEAAGYTVTKVTLDGLPATVGSFATNSDSGFQGGYAVSGKGLRPPSTDLSDTVTILVYENADQAGKALEDLGGETVNRQGSGNRIYLYGGGVAGDTPPPELQPVIDASEGG